MLTRALKPNIEILRGATTQLLIWSECKKALFCTFLDDKEKDFPPERSRYSRRRNDYRFYDENDYDDNFQNNRRNSFNPGRNRYQNDSYYRDSYRFNSRKFSAESLNLLDKDISFNEDLKPKVSSFYKPHPDSLNRSREEIEKFYKENDIKIFGRSRNECPSPILSFNELDIPESASNVIRKLGYSTPTPVQSQTWPIVLSGYNMVGISRTGSGKTLGFILPGIVHIRNQEPVSEGDGPIVLVVAPTRELVQQIHQVTIPFARSLNIRVASVYGGSAKNSQIGVLMRRPEICIGTPGRLNDLLNSDYLNLRRCTYLVLDEADRLLDMGFHPQIKSIFHYCRPDRQVSMWSATWPNDVEYLAKNFLREYIAVKFGTEDLTANSDISQFVHVCEEYDKFNLLRDLLRKINDSNDNKTLIFVSTKIKADTLGERLRNAGYRSVTLHGDKSQKNRDRALQVFRDGIVKIMVGTQVVGRGIDIEDIRYVIVYDFPTDIENYVHIIGRTARCGRPGTAHTFFTYNDKPKLKDLIKVLNQCKQPINPKLQEMAEERSLNRSRHRSRWDDI